MTNLYPKGNIRTQKGPSKKFNRICRNHEMGHQKSIQTDPGNLLSKGFGGKGNGTGYGVSGRF